MIAYTLTTGANNFPGTSDADTFAGPGGGLDTLNGAGGADTFTIDGAQIGSIDGGTETDTVVALDNELNQNLFFDNVEILRLNSTITNFYATTAQLSAFSSIVLDHSPSDFYFFLQGGAGAIDFSTRFPASSVLHVEANLMSGGAQITGTANADQIAGSSFGDVLVGGGGDDTLFGSAGNDTLNGGTGADTMQGGADNDIYYVDDVGDVVVEAAGGGIDTVYTRVSYALGAGQEVEFLRTISQGATTAINLTGNALAQTIYGNAGDNQISDGGGAADTMMGFGGNDSYFVRNANAVIVEGSSAGTNDSVAAAVSYTLGAGVYIERMSTISSGATTAIDLTGNEIAQTIVGNKGNNVLSGKGGNDILIGGQGKDTFVFDTAPNSNSNRDTINDFVSVDDSILLSKSVFSAIVGNGKLWAGQSDSSAHTAQDLGDRMIHTNAITPLTANQFYASATGTAHDLDDRIIYNTSTGALIYDQNGSNPGGAIQFATLANIPTIDASDFYLV